MPQVSSADEVELAGSRGTANFALKWARDARQQANMQVIEDIKGLPLAVYRWAQLRVTVRSCVQHAVSGALPNGPSNLEGSSKPASSSKLFRPLPVNICVLT